MDLMDGFIRLLFLFTYFFDFYLLWSYRDLEIGEWKCRAHAKTRSSRVDVWAVDKTGMSGGKQGSSGLWSAGLGTIVCRMLNDYDDVMR